MESDLLRAFQGGARRFLPEPPPEDDTLSWLALMQHHGVPTRLVDWTLSPYVAAYFAAEQEDRNAEQIAIYAIDFAYLRDVAGWLLKTEQKVEKVGHQIRLGDPELFVHLLVEKRMSVVAPIQSLRSNERQTYQKGVFLCPGSLEVSFEDNLQAMVRDHPPKNARRMVRILLPPTEREKMLKSLDLMNINRATLFPGLDGFSQNLRKKLELLNSPSRLRTDDYGKSGFYAEFGRF